MMHKLCQSKLFPFPKERVHTIQLTIMHPKAIIHTYNSNILSQVVNPFTYGVFLIVPQTITTLLTSRTSRRNSRITSFQSLFNLQQDKQSTPRVTTFCVRVTTFSIMSLTSQLVTFKDFLATRESLLTKCNIVLVRCLQSLGQVLQCQNVLHPKYYMQAMCIFPVLQSCSYVIPTYEFDPLGSLNQVPCQKSGFPKKLNQTKICT